MSSVAQDRQTKGYRFLESLLGISSIGFLIILVICAYFLPVLTSIFLIIYSFLWLLKFALNVVYTLYTYKQLRRWEKVNWPELLAAFEKSEDLIYVQNYLLELKNKYPNKLDWHEKIEIDLKVLPKIASTKFAKPLKIYQIANFAVYNEGFEVLERSMQALFESKYPLEQLLVFVSQEDRLGEDFNSKIREELAKQSWLKIHIQTNQEIEKQEINLVSDRLNVFFVQHPDGLVGEIKGKASNEDWGARQAQKVVEKLGIDEEMVLVTSLDADSHIGKYFFHNLSYRYCLTETRANSGFQPVHVYSNNFFQTGLWPRQVATQTTIHNMMNLSLDDEIVFFAIYSIPLPVLKKVDFWVKDLIAEDYLMFIKCFTVFEGNFKVVPFYGIFEGDAVEADDYLEAIINQYKQLQRWAWGGVEGFPYMFKRFFWEEIGGKIDLRLRLKWTWSKFSNHFFWSLNPLIFSIAPFLPQLFNGPQFQQSAIAQNLAFWSQYFSWISFIFIFFFGYITITFIGVAASKPNKLSFIQICLILVQLGMSPFLYGLTGVPAMDAQVRGMLGKYLGYWVTPKK